MLKRIVVSGLMCLPAIVVGCSAAPAGWVNFFHPEFSIATPADYSPHVVPLDVVGKGIRAYYFNVPARFVNGTNLSADTRLDVEIRTDVYACTPDYFLDDATGFTVEIQGANTFNVAKTSDAGAGNLYENDVYAVANSKPCVAVRYFVHSHNIMNYDPGSVRPFDAAGLAREFDEIRKSLVVTHLK